MTYHWACNTSDPTCVTSGTRTVSFPEYPSSLSFFSVVHIAQSLVVFDVHVAHRFSFLCYGFLFSLSLSCLVYPMLTVFMDCPFLIAFLVFSNVYCRSLFVLCLFILAIALSFCLRFMDSENPLVSASIS